MAEGTPQTVTIAGKTFVRALPTIVKKVIDDSHYYWVNNEYNPGVTSILDEAAPTAYQLRKFWQDNTAEESNEKLVRSQEFGTKIHQACEDLLLGKTLDLAGDFPHSREKKTIMSFHDWFNLYQPYGYVAEHTVASIKYKIAGTLDFAGFLNDGKFWIIDFKTAAGIYFSHELQLMAYKALFEEMYGIKVDRVGILRLGAKTKAGFEFKTDNPEAKYPIKRTFKDFLRVYHIYLSLHDGKIPNPPEVKDYPATLRLIEEKEKEEIEG